MDREEIMLKEYELCQSDSNSYGNQSWISFSIIMSVNLVLIAQVVPLVFNSSRDSGYGRLIVVVALSAAMIFILRLFKQWDKRAMFRIRLNNVRMREIENEFMAINRTWVLQKNWRIRSLDITHSTGRQEEIPSTFQPILNHLRALFPRHRRETDDTLFQTEYVATVTRGRWNFHNIFWVLIAIWILIIIAEGLIYIWPTARYWLLN